MQDGTGYLTKPLMFLSSYAPLFLILAVRFEGPFMRVVCVVLAVLGVGGLFVLMHFQHEPPSQQGRFQLADVRQAGEGASSYLAGYLLPFVSIGDPTATDLIAYLGFFAVAYLVTTRTGIIQVNPTLFVFGYRVHLIVDAKGFQGYLVSRTKGNISAGTTVLASRMTSDVLLFEGVVAPLE